MTDSLSIRLASPAQVEQIRDLTLRAYAKWVPITPRKPRPMTADYDVAVRENRFDCLYEDDQFVGLIETVQQGDELMIVNVAIDPDHQGRGFGTRLMKHAEEIARVASLRATRLYTNKLMTENIVLYERLGYRFEKETHHDLGTVVHMVRPVS
ncbi:GNAT family N-acetyltransferase [Sphingomonas sp. CL5.1]|uniref:GNAT family N-acetyltransferase n=1 Tax=Sphingomonas sp. CL5.1 TaxID=2653203 RepID=UPI0015830277|nr:GNAT family N-acetyltransferase [Sphingomonas sp. CL5.1]QKR99544.1 GNAT family N-acetyltransferase [Sphingomonas sp. CL5.1]